MEQLTEYNPQNLSKRDTSNIESLSLQNVSSVSKLVAAAQDLNNNILLYKECLVDYMNIKTEILDIQNKYKNNTVNGKGVGSGSLPGVYAQPQSYNLEEIKNDSTRMENLKLEERKVKNQLDNYQALCREDIKLVIEYWKIMNRCSMNFNNYILELDKIIN